MPFRETTTADRGGAPVGFGIDITTRCNLDCITCYYLDSPPNRPTACSDLSRERFALAMDQAAAAGFRELYVLGGEPTLHADIVDMLASAKRRGFAEVLLVTNGLRLSSRDFCRRVAETGASLAVQRHVLGDDETAQRVQATLAGKPGTLARINQAFTNIEGLFPPERVAVQCCLTRPVVESGQLYAVFRYARRHGFAHVIECTKASPRFARGGPLDLTPQELASVYRELGRIEVEELGGLPNPPTPQAFGKTCHMPENGVHCLIDGTIVPCVGQPFPLGNLFAPEGARLEAILASRERAFFTDPLPRLHGHCQACPHVQACTGGCRGDAFFLTGCFSASAVQCPQLAASTRRLSLADFVPATCDACPLAGAPRCRPKAGAGRVLAGYLGAIYQDEP